MSKKRTGFIGWHDMQVGLYYWKVCVTGGGRHVFHENVLWEDSVVGGHVLQVCAEATI